MGHSTSTASSVSSSSSHKALGEERRSGKGRGGGKGGARGRGLSKYQEPGDAGGRAVGHSAKERDSGKEEKKRSPKQIKFELPGSTEVKEQEQGGKHGAFADPSKNDTPSSNNGGGDGISESKSKLSSGRITYDRVS